MPRTPRYRQTNCGRGSHELPRCDLPLEPEGKGADAVGVGYERHLGGRQKGQGSSRKDIQARLLRSRDVLLVASSCQFQGTEIDEGFVYTGSPQTASSVSAARRGMHRSVHITDTPRTRLKEPRYGGKKEFRHLALPSGERMIGLLLRPPCVTKPSYLRTGRQHIPQMSDFWCYLLVT
jgi:hypothetical protein